MGLKLILLLLQPPKLLKLQVYAMEIDVRCILRLYCIVMCIKASAKRDQRGNGITAEHVEAEWTD